MLMFNTWGDYPTPDQEPLEAVMRFCLDRGFEVVFEGNFKLGTHNALLKRLLKAHPDENYFFYLDVSLEETLKRHETRTRSCVSSRHSEADVVIACSAPRTGVCRGPRSGVWWRPTAWFGDAGYGARVLYRPLRRTAEQIDDYETGWSLPRETVRTPSYGFRIEGESIYHENFEPTGENASLAMLPRCRN